MTVEAKATLLLIAKIIASMIIGSIWGFYCIGVTLYLDSNSSPVQPLYWYTVLLPAALSYGELGQSLMQTEFKSVVFILPIIIAFLIVFGAILIISRLISIFRGS